MAPVAPSAPVEIFRADYVPPSNWVTDVDLDFNITPNLTTVQADLTVSTNPASPLFQKGSKDLVLDGDATSVTLTSIKIDGQALTQADYHTTPTQLIVHSSAFADKPTFTLSTVVTTVPEDNTQLSGLYKSGSMYCSQCEAEGFRRITYYPDRPDNMATFNSVKITADKNEYPVLLSNGNLLFESATATTHSATWSDPFPKPSYLFAVVVGDLKSITGEFTTMSDRKVHLEIFSEKENVEKLDYAMESLKKSMLWDEEKYGLEYDLDVFNIVAVNDFNMGAMENKGLNVFNTAYVLADQKTATDGDYSRVEGVIGHEYFHNWTGNRVTCRDWFQLTLKEGLTVFRDQQFSGEMNSPAVQRIGDVMGLRGRQFAEDGGPMSHPVRPESYIAMDNFYTATVYSKGAEIVRMYHTLLSQEGFRKGMDLYFKRHDGSAVTCDDFREAMADANNRDFTQFGRWYSQSGTPTVTYDHEYDDKTGEFTLTLSQTTPTQPQNEPFHIPVSFGIVDSLTGSELLPTRVLELKEASKTFKFLLTPEGTPVPSILRGFSAPVKVVNAKGEDEDMLVTLAAFDTDGFNRWESGQKLFSKFIFNHLQSVCTELGMAKVEKAFRETLESDGDNALRTFAMMLPSEAALSEEMTVIDPTGLRQSRGELKKSLAAKFEEELTEVYEKLTSEMAQEEFKVDAESVGRRMLRNVCLDYLCAKKDGVAAALASKHYFSANCMTDKMAAMGVLSGVDGEGSDTRDAVMDNFYIEAAGDALVVNKWFSVQATAGKKDVLADVKRLAEHTDFTLNNPNRVRSLVGAFTGNLAAFHGADGEGYKFVGKVVRELDTLNPQVAARMVGCLINFKRYDESRGAMMKAELEEISKVEGLSGDVFEVVNRALA